MRVHPFNLEEHPKTRCHVFDRQTDWKAETRDCPISIHLSKHISMTFNGLFIASSQSVLKLSNTFDLATFITLARGLFNTNVNRTLT